MTGWIRAALSVLAIPASFVTLTAGTSAQQPRTASGAVVSCGHVRWTATVAN